MTETTRTRRAAKADAGRAMRAAGALQHLVVALTQGGDVTLWASNAAKCIAKYHGRPCDPEVLRAMPPADLVEWAERLDRYVESVNRRS